MAYATVADRCIDKLAVRAEHCVRAGWLSLAVAGATVPAAAQTMGDAAQGRVLAQAVCADCHDVRRGGDASLILDATPFQALADRRATTEISLRAFLRLPHKDMPDLILTDEQVDNIVAYILGLR
jgi:mono/diheme cytochrome c family protein